MCNLCLRLYNAALLFLTALGCGSLGRGRRLHCSLFAGSADFQRGPLADVLGVYLALPL